MYSTILFSRAAHSPADIDGYLPPPPFLPQMKKKKNVGIAVLFPAQPNVLRVLTSI